MSDEEQLEKLARQIVVCTKCELHRSRKNAVPGDGPTHAEIMFIGEGPGAREDELGPVAGGAVTVEHGGDLLRVSDVVDGSILMDD